jgi:hypothetical protein
MRADLEKYRPLLARLNMPEAREDELIHIVYRIVESFVDRAFGLDSTQLARAVAIRKSSENRRIPARIEAYSINDETRISAARNGGAKEDS